MIIVRARCSSRLDVSNYLDYFNSHLSLFLLLYSRVSHLALGVLSLLAFPLDPVDIRGVFSVICKLDMKKKKRPLALHY